jgi:IS30 family transposase
MEIIEEENNKTQKDFQQYLNDLSKEQLRVLFLTLRARMIEEKLIYEKTEHNKNEYVIAGQTKMEEVNKSFETVKQFCEELKLKGYIPINREQIDKHGFGTLVHRGDHVSILLKPPSITEELKKRKLQKLEDDKDKMDKKQYERIKKALQPKEFKPEDDRVVIRSGGFVNSINPDQGWFSVKVSVTSISFQIDFLHGILIKPLGTTRRDQLNFLIKGIPIPKKEPPQKPQAQQPKEEKKEAKVAGIEKDVEVPDAHNKILHDLYYKDKNMVGRDKLLKLAKEKNPNITKRQVMSWLHAQKSHQLYAPARGKGIVQPIVSKGPWKHIQIDLIDYQTLKANNHGKAFILTIIDIYSKRGWAYALANKTAAKVRDAIKKWFEKDEHVKNHHVGIIQMDNGTEFNEVVKYLESQDVKTVRSHAYSPQSNGAVEKFNGILKSMLKRYMTEQNTKKWVNVLDTMIKNYNNQTHGTTGKKPKEVNVKTDEVDEKLQNQAKHKMNYSNKNYLPNDKVRVRLNKEDPKQQKPFNWSEEVYTIKRIIRSKNPLNMTKYVLVENNKQYFEYELQKVTKIQTSKMKKAKKIKGHDSDTESDDESSDDEDDEGRLVLHPEVIDGEEVYV